MNYRTVQIHFQLSDLIFAQFKEHYFTYSEPCPHDPAFVIETLKKKRYSTFTKLWQSCSDPHLKIRPIAIFAFYFLNYSLAARLQDNSHPKSPTKVKEKITAIYCLWMGDNERGREWK